MFNKKIASEIAVGIILLLALVIGGIFWLQGKQAVSVVENAQPVVEKPKAQEPIKEELVFCTQEAKQCADGSYVGRKGPNCEFEACPESRTAKTGYKIVEVKNPDMHFSFEVPEKWLTETRHSGEKQLSTEEMRDFLATNYDGDIKKDSKLTSDYADFPWSMLKVMGSEEIEKYYFRDYSETPYPDASVAAGNHIWYTDTSWQQIDFSVEDSSINSVVDRVKKEQLDFCNKYSEDIVGCGTDGPTWTKLVINGMNVEIATYSTDVDENGNEAITKGGSGGKIYYVEVAELGKTLKIFKQAKGGRQYENDFENLIQTLQIKSQS